jgi:dihydrofolate reductase
VARARQIAGDRDVGVNGREIARQCFDAGLLDEVHVDLVPVFLGSGIALLGQIKDAPVELEGPISVTQGKGVTHLGYRVVRK